MTPADAGRSAVSRSAMDILRTTGVYVLTSVLTALSSFCISMFFARLLGKEGLGLYSVALTGTMIGALLADLGIDSYVLRAFAGNAHADNLGRLLRIKLISSAIAAFGTLSLLALTFHGLRLPFVAAALWVIPRSCTGLFEGYLRAVRRRTALASVSVGFSLIAPVAAYAVLSSGFDLGGTMLVLLGTESARVILLALLVGAPGVGAEAPPLGTLMRAILPFAFIGTISYVTSRIDVVLLGALRGSQEAGVYAAADRFLISGNLLAFALYGAAFPAFSAMTDLVHRHRVVIQTIRTGILLSAGGAAVLFIFAPELISLTYRFTESVALLRILSLSVPGVIVNSILGSALFALHRERLIATVLGVTCAANIVLNCVSIPLFGATGSAVISVLTEYGFMGVYGVVFVQEARRMPAR